MPPKRIIPPMSREEQQRRYNQLVKPHLGLIRKITRVHGKGLDHESAAQEIKLRIIQRADTFNPDKRLEPWVATIAMNYIRSLHREAAAKKPKRTGPHKSTGQTKTNYRREVLGTDFSSEEFFPEKPTQFTPEMALAEREETAFRRRSVRVAIQKLPDKQKNIISYIYGIPPYKKAHSYEQAVAEFRIPIGTVKSRVHDAKLNLRAALK